jgi:toxin YoeB
MEVAYELIYYKDALKDIDHWKKTGDKQAIKKIDKILEVLENDPYSPLPGEPEKLKYAAGYSRRINRKDRVTYDINDEKREVIIFSARGHYDDK